MVRLVRLNEVQYVPPEKVAQYTEQGFIVAELEPPKTIVEEAAEPAEVEEPVEGPKPKRRTTKKVVEGNE